ncbi:stage 0 sporulation protein B (sporulation initiation phosphotransferase) [Salinibacillus kushneri]|uniref:Stage 0 sporulation protein B (Sporulation initiation phosphotransferase) n=1 Tax=Salinibacillus kushneri TaxID=237682 RepID=A0A1I0GA29_9BACI|nr:Spo0B domain-containing protein [Salinibacillus kushneri]SET67731.1 stage 0 sporulation protein B (sporulation initiation phosphotransferase) [Salinibacillus kushneri]
MKDEEVVDLLRHYRHDLLNHLQLIQGYAQMDKIEKVKENTNNLLNLMSQERKLSNLNGPAFTLWVLNFNSTYDLFRLSYKIELDYANLSSIDRTLVHTCEEMMEQLHKHVSNEQIYNGNLVLYKYNSYIKMKITFEGSFVKHHELKNNLLREPFVQNIEIDNYGLSIRLWLS